MVKNCCEELTELLVHIYNLSFRQGIFPEKLKQSKVIPIFKKGDSAIMSNYRPISLTSPFGKILEKLMHKRLSSYFDKYKILYEYQFGFRKSYSTSLAVLDVITMIENEIFNTNCVMGIFLDLQNVFDTVNIDILITKLEHYGIRGHMLNWFISYLKERTQVTFVNGVYSTMSKTVCGVPQGTVLGPLLFLIYINDISKATNLGKIRLFADDSNLFIVSNNLQDLFSQANDALQDLYMWLTSNKLSINLDKTNYMIFKPTSNINETINKYKLSIKINNLVLPRISSTKYLGIFIDEKLTWKEHISHLINKVKSLIGILYRRRHLLPPNCKRNIYFAIIYSSLVYGIEVYANTYKSYLNPLIIKCNCLLRLVQNESRMRRVIDLYKTYNTLPVDLLFKLYIMKL